MAQQVGAWADRLAQHERPKLLFEPEPTAEIASEPPRNLLARYMSDVGPIGVLRPEEEFTAAREIAELELAAWTEIFSHSTTAGRALAILERELEPASAARVRREVTGSRRDRAARKRTRHAARIAELVRSLDEDHRLAKAAIAELERVVGFATDAGLRQHVARAVELDRQARDARNRFVAANLRLVVTIAKRYDHGGLALSDLIQEGNIGLIKAVCRYDYRRGYRFSTYASWWIRHSIGRALADKGRTVRIPVHMLQVQRQVASASERLNARLGREPTLEETCQSTRLPSEQVEQLQSAFARQSLSLDRMLSADDDRTHLDMLADPRALQPMESVANESVVVQVTDVLQQLSSIEADVINRRFGLAGAKVQTLKEIGESHRLSRERIRQIQERALQKIRRALMRRKAI
jgi:RNA polymerase primary sigma factor